MTNVIIKKESYISELTGETIIWTAYKNNKNKSKFSTCENLKSLVITLQESNLNIKNMFEVMGWLVDCSMEQNNQ